jgi:hypothetical protein
LSDRSAQTYERLIEYPELRKLEAQLQEAQQQTLSVQVQMKLLTVVERMKRSQEQHMVQQAYYYHSGQGNGSHVEATTCAG